MKPVAPKPVKLFAGILYSNHEIMINARKSMEQKLGTIDYVSESYPFEVTDYYENEMGSPIMRLFVSFEPLIDPGKIGEIKVCTNSVEADYSADNKRKVNIDSGYIDFDKVILASAKYNWQKIYINNGIYADPTLRFEKGTYHPFPWSFPDFKQPTYYSALLKIRDIYKSQLRYKKCM